MTMRNLILLALSAALLFALAMAVASAHGPADWIRGGDFKAVNGTTCCSDKDCGVIYPSFAFRRRR